MDLRSIVIAGRLDHISIGDGDPTLPAVGVLHVGSIGVIGAYFYGGAGILRVDGDLGSVHIYQGRLGGATIGGSIGSLSVRAVTGEIEVGGDVVGEISLGPRGNTPKEPVHRGQDLDRLVIGGSLFGSIDAKGTIGSIRVKGDVGGVGGLGYSGRIDSHAIGVLRVEGSVIGGSGPHSGSIFSQKGIGSAIIEGDITGGDGYFSGRIGFRGKHSESFWLGGSLSRWTRRGLRCPCSEAGNLA
jgi:hypothetical protein